MAANKEYQKSISAKIAYCVLNFFLNTQKLQKQERWGTNYHDELQFLRFCTKRNMKSCV